MKGSKHADNLYRFQVSGVSPAAGLKSGLSNHQETETFWRSFIRAAPLAKKTASLIEKETLKKRI